MTKRLKPCLYENLFCLGIRHKKTIFIQVWIQSHFHIHICISMQPAEFDLSDRFSGVHIHRLSKARKFKSTWSKRTGLSMNDRLNRLKAIFHLIYDNIVNGYNCQQQKIKTWIFSGFLDASCDVGWPGGQSALNKGPQVHQHWYEGERSVMRHCIAWG